MVALTLEQFMTWQNDHSSVLSGTKSQ